MAKLIAQLRIIIIIMIVSWRGKRKFNSFLRKCFLAMVVSKVEAQMIRIA